MYSDDDSESDRTWDLGFDSHIRNGLFMCHPDPVTRSSESTWFGDIGPNNQHQLFHVKTKELKFLRQRQLTSKQLTLLAYPSYFRDSSRRVWVDPCPGEM